MAMYANVNGASKLLAQTSAEAAGGGVTVYEYPGDYISDDPVNVVISYSRYYLMFWGDGYDSGLYFQGIHDKNTSSFYGFVMAKSEDDYILISQFGLISEDYLEWYHTKDDVSNGYNYKFSVTFNDNGFTVNRAVLRSQKTQTFAGNFTCLYFKI